MIKEIYVKTEDELIEAIYKAKPNEVIFFVENGWCENVDNKGN